MHHDGIVIGGGYAGKTTVLQLVRARRTSSSFAEAMGRALEKTPFGIQLRTDAESKTSVSLAVCDGAMAGVRLYRSPLWPAAVYPVQKEAAAP